MIKHILIALLICALIILFFRVFILNDYLFAISFSALLFIITNLAWSLLPLRAKRIFLNDKKRFLKISLPCLILLFFGTAAINYYLLPEISHPPTLLGNVTILLFILLLARNLIKPRKKVELLIGTVVFILIIYLAASIDRYIC